MHRVPNLVAWDGVWAAVGARLLKVGLCGINPRLCNSEEYVYVKYILNRYSLAEIRKQIALSRGNVFEALVQPLSFAAAVGGRLPCRPSIHVVTSARDRRVGMNLKVSSL